MGNHVPLSGPSVLGPGLSLTVLSVLTLWLP